MSDNNEKPTLATGSGGQQATRGRDKPWIFRTYAGHSTASKSNKLYRKNLAKGQTGLSIAFDLPTQTGYDSDSRTGAGRGRQGRRAGRAPRRHAPLLDGIPLDQMNTSMTINATAAWLLALYIAIAEEQGVDRAHADRHDPERHHQGIPLARHLHLPARAVAAADQRHVASVYQRLPKWNPMNVCSYHLQEAGATPVQELAYALATAIAVLDAVKAPDGPPSRLRAGVRAAFRSS